MVDYFADSPDNRTRVRGPWMLLSMAGLVLAIFLAVVLPTGLSAVAAAKESAPVYSYEVVAEYPHDPEAFTQGLAIDRGELFESTGLFDGRSSLRRVDLKTGEVLKMVNLPDDEFGEGIAIIKNRIYMLTWRSRKGYVFDRDTLKVLDTWTYKGEGWGLTTDGEQLIMTNGGPKLHFYDPETLTPVREQNDAGRTVDKVRYVKAEKRRTFEGLNELEYIDNRVWSNVLGRDWILQISPKTGKVLGFVDLTGLYPPSERPERQAVLNGIAFDRATGKRYVTGKLWPKLYEIRIVEKLE